MVYYPVNDVQCMDITTICESVAELHKAGEDGTEVGVVELWYVLCWLSKTIAQCCLCNGEVELLKKGKAN